MECDTWPAELLFSPLPSSPLSVSPLIAETGPLPFLRGQYSLSLSLSLSFSLHFPGDSFNKLKSSTSPTQSRVVGILGPREREDAALLGPVSALNDISFRLPRRGRGLS